MAALASGDSNAEALFTEATQAFEDLEAKAAENSTYKRTAAQRIERLPHLSVKPMSPEDAAAASVPVPALTEPLVTEPVEALPVADDASPATEVAPEGN